MFKIKIMRIRMFFFWEFGERLEGSPVHFCYLLGKIIVDLQLKREILPCHG